MSAEKPYCIFTTNGGRHIVDAPSLRTAIRRFDKKGQGPIVAACAVACMPAPMAEDCPFLVVILNNPHFVPPEGLE
jgi:hypothetical protein